MADGHAQMRGDIGCCKVLKAAVLHDVGLGGIQTSGWNTSRLSDVGAIARSAKRERDEIGDVVYDQVSKLGRRLESAIGQQGIRVPDQKSKSVSLGGDGSHRDVIDADHERRQDGARNSNDG